MFTCFQNHAMLLQSNPATLDPSGDGDIWQQCWKSDGGRYHHNHLKHRMDAELLGWMLGVSLQNRTVTFMHQCTNVTVQCSSRKTTSPPAAGEGSWQPLLSYHCHSTKQEEPQAESGKAVLRAATSRWCC